MLISGRQSIRFAVNYSLEIEKLMHAGLVKLDLYKLPDWPDLISSINHQFPSYVHFTLAAGMDELSKVDWETMDHLRAQTGTRYVNLHFVAPQKLDPRDPEQVESTLRQAIADVQFAAKRFGVDNVILENVPIRAGESFLLPVVDPTNIARIIRETGCGLLLDLAHARLCAGYLGMEERDYLEALPVDRLRELHITGIGMHDGLWIDHMTMQSEDWRLLDWSLAQIRAGRWAKPEIAAFEYGGLGEIFRWRSESSVLAEQVPQIWRRLHG